MITQRLARAQALRSFQTRNFRLWYVGQSISMVGYYGQSVALALLVLELTGNGVVLGMVGSLQFAPSLVLGPWAGVISDRMHKRQLMLVTQSVLMVITTALAVLVLSGHVTTTWLVVMSALSGIAWAFDQPGRRTIASELVAPEHLTNAVSLNGALDNMAKVVGAALSGVLITLVGVGWSFAFNAASSIAVLAALKAMDTTTIHWKPSLDERPGRVVDGLRHVWRNHEILVRLMILGVLMTAAWNWNVLVPLMATEEFGGGGGTVALLMGSLSAGALCGTLWLARLDRAELRLLASACVLFAASYGLLSAAPAVAVACLAAASTGASGVVVFNGIAAGIQLEADMAMRGRVIAVFTMVVHGGVAIGWPLAGIVAQQLGVRPAVVVGALAAGVIAVVLRLHVNRSGMARRPAWTSPYSMAEPSFSIDNRAPLPSGVPSAAATESQFGAIEVFHEERVHDF